MSYKIIPTLLFVKELKRLTRKFPSLKIEYAALIHDLLINPSSGTFIGNNCYKIRMAIKSKGKGKSGSARVITYIYREKETIYLLTIYDKGEKQDLRPFELEGLINSLDL